MASIAIVTLGSHGHMNPALAIAAELVSRDHRVTYFSTSAFRAAIREVGAQFEEYESTFGADGRAMAKMRTHVPYVNAMLLNEALEVFPQIAGKLSALAPDVVIYDRFCLAGRFAAERMRVVRISLCFTYATNAHFSVRRHCSMPPASPDVLRVTNEIAEKFLARHQFSIVNSLASKPGDSEPSLVLMPREFHVAGETFGSNYRFVGPCIRRRPHQALGDSIPFAGADDGRPRALIALGTIFTDAPQFYRLCFDAFRDSNWNVAMATGQLITPGSLGPVPSNFHLDAHLPQLEILPTVDVFVCHGGMNSTMEALYFGIPVISVPHIPEQTVTGQRIEELELGCNLDVSTLTSKQLLDAANFIIGSRRIKNRVREMQVLVRDAGGAKRAATVVDELLQAEPQISLRSRVASHA